MEYRMQLIAEYQCTRKTRKQIMWICICVRASERANLGKRKIETKAEEECTMHHKMVEVRAAGIAGAAVAARCCKSPLATR